ncbi:glycosyltransferase [Pseudidiomarina tainanensis]|uniref:Glycosyltransferase involved in cell wall biosynthesis n=1 Tax=Pseudidiomarina tainanensis TaxID=502365 RepID=A0A368UJN9_9GAMM|nr:glycosyltransferase [Pseudidiomarina tainanensis]RCW28878.1 glycosyltransferase involved in cell wall biosynthesis [Pseudidiomarina tainanensis]
MIGKQDTHKLIMKKDKPKVLFLSFYLPYKESVSIIQNDSWPQIQTVNFLEKFVKSTLFKNNHFDIEFISAPPVTDYPNFRKIFFRKKIYKDNSHGVDKKIISIAFLNLPIIKILTRFFSFLIEMIFRKDTPHAAIICFSIHLPMLFSSYIVSRFKKIPLIGVWTDPPNIPNEFDPYVKRKLRKAEAYLVQYLMKRCDAVIALTECLAVDFSQANSTKYLILNGFAPDVKCSAKIRNSTKLTIVHIGSLMERYGLKLLIDAFDELRLEDVELVFYGVGDVIPYLEKIIEKNSAIKYNGFLNPDQVTHVLNQADFLINCRDPNADLVKYSFPSKMLEYLASGTPIITTLLPSFSRDIDRSVILINGYDKESIKEAILIAKNINDRRYNDLSKSSLTVARSFTVESQSTLIQSFITSVIK